MASPVSSWLRAQSILFMMCWLSRCVELCSRLSRIFTEYAMREVSSVPTKMRCSAMQGYTKYLPASVLCVYVQSMQRKRRRRAISKTSA